MIILYDFRQAGLYCEGDDQSMRSAALRTRKQRSRGLQTDQSAQIDFTTWSIEILGYALRLRSKRRQCTNTAPIIDA